MAKCRVDSMDDLLQTLENAADVDSISEEMLAEGAQVLQKNIREEITSAADRGYATGELGKLGDTRYSREKCVWSLR